MIHESINKSILQLLPRIPNYLNMSKLTVSKEFIEEFTKAENTFIHQVMFLFLQNQYRSMLRCHKVIFDPRQRCQRPLTPYPCPTKADQKASDETDDDVSRVSVYFPTEPKFTLCLSNKDAFLLSLVSL